MGNIFVLLNDIKNIFNFTSLKYLNNMLHIIDTVWSHDVFIIIHLIPLIKVCKYFLLIISDWHHFNFTAIVTDPEPFHTYKSDSVLEYRQW